uniref:Uncharacterized protein n=1 Tax=Euplotes harpa TaxID=151035 RepID=A0A7S3J386_9SPIT|mmetsp:Transcript_12431/g.14240  ORF Transcript_12431/g.14240 Transcript_12431/m.14240 type:complete len:128 (+) Transcript_12431:25-408(+)
MWDWFDYDQDDDKEESNIELDFQPITRTKDPFAEEDQIDGDSDGGADFYDNEDELFEGKKKTYQADPEMDVGFPEGKQEYEAQPCLEDVLEEYNSYPRGRALKPIKQGMGLMLHGDPSFFDDDEYDE